jgi:electron transfer flavoprotein alpha subunit
VNPAAKDVWVFVDHMDGRPMRVSLELLAEARRIADETSGRVDAIVFGLDEAAPLAQLAQHGADRICLFETGDPSGYDPDAYTATLGEVSAAEAPLLILLPATSRGTDLAGRLSAARGWPLFPRAVNVRLRDDGLEITRALAAGKIHAQLMAVVAGPCLVTVASDVIGTDDPDAGREAVVVRKHLVTPAAPLIEVRGLIGSDPATVDLTEAETVVSVGRGMGAAENVRLVERLAQVLGGSVAGTRVAVDLGWLPKTRQVGQTGKTVRPRLYVACGLSGATQHTMGMKQSDTIIAINTDPSAPIFKIADLSVTADAVELLPLLAEKCRRAIVEQ